MKLNLTRPLAFFDLETTGTNVVADRIVEIAIYKVMPDGTSEEFIRLVNPGIPIPAEVTAIHGIKDEDVSTAPTFAQLAPALERFLANCDLAGYNSNKFDVPMLIEEFLRCGINFDVKKRRLIDVQNIFHKMEPRTLRAAYKFYCGKEHQSAHQAQADTQATYEILLAQLERYRDVEYTDNDGKTSIPIANDMDALYRFSYNQLHADLVGHIGISRQGKEVFNFGKHKGREVEEVFKKEPQYYDWMMNADFPLSTKNVITTIYLRSKNQGNFLFKS
ncbi:MAG TPA: 3'-5' exonuclease [Bacteroidales bacterium]|nr:3'-5' exonuclease [Bacteroidales bacterium]